MDDFKQVNDTLGHSGGDYVLSYFAIKMKEHLGQNALMGRYGGDEFVVLLYDVEEEEAAYRFNTLVKSMDTEIAYAGNTRKVSISLGAAYYSELDSFETMFGAADEVLYQAKRAHKNIFKMKVMS